MSDPCGRTLLWLASGVGGSPPAGVADPALADALLTAAVREGLAGLLFAQARAGGWHRRLPERAGRRLESIYYLTVQANLRALTTLREIAAQGVPFVLMQGAALLVTTYADPGLRPLSDIDLWVQPRDFERLASVLRRRGFDENPLTPGVFRRGEALVDVHTGLHWAERIRSSRFLFAGEPGAVQRRCVTRAWEGTTVRCLDPIDQAVYLTVHAIKHNLERLIWLADLNRLVGEWGVDDWAVFRERARELGQPRIGAILAYLRQNALRSTDSRGSGGRRAADPAGRIPAPAAPPGAAAEVVIACLCSRPAARRARSASRTRALSRGRRCCGRSSRIRDDVSYARLYGLRVQADGGHAAVRPAVSVEQPKALRPRFPGSEGLFLCHHLWERLSAAIVCRASRCRRSPCTKEPSEPCSVSSDTQRSHVDRTPDHPRVAVEVRGRQA